MELSRRTRGGRAGALLVELARHADFVKGSVRDRGLRTTVAGVGRFTYAHLNHPRTAARRRQLSFRVGATDLRYELARYNTAWLNERSIEVSVLRHLLRDVDPADVLEVGNVLGHYGCTGQTVLDKYEVIDGVVNEDILDYAPGRQFDAVVALSTLEHVGFDEPEKDPDATVKALDALRRLVSPTGFVAVTVPLGYNPGLNAAIADGRFSTTHQYAMRRVNADNDWVQVPLEEALTARYGEPYPNGNAIFIGIDGPGADRVAF